MNEEIALREITFNALAIKLQNFECFTFDTNLIFLQ